jgi:segregation and condensation protein B
MQTLMNRRPLVPGRIFGSVALRYQPRGRLASWPDRRGAASGLPPRVFLGAQSETATEQQSTSRARRDLDQRDPQTALVEAALFLAAEPLTARKLAQLAGLDDATLARTLVRRLNEHYQRDGSAFQVEEIAGGFQLMTHPRFGGWLRRLHPAAAGARLSSPALETLAVVAYRQPAVRAEIESIRGVQCGEMLRQLMDRDLIRIVGKSQELGRPFLYGTTKRFLQAFGLARLEDLPRADQLRAQPPAEAQRIAGSIPATTEPTTEPYNSGAGRSDDSN